jgi:hypothetical protein
MSTINHERQSVMRILNDCHRALIEAGLTEDDARTSLEVLVARMPIDPFAIGALPLYFGDLDWELRKVSAEDRSIRLFSEFGSDAIRAASILCRRYAIAPEGVKP